MSLDHLLKVVAFPGAPGPVPITNESLISKV